MADPKQIKIPNAFGENVLAFFAIALFIDMLDEFTALWSD